MTQIRLVGALWSLVNDYINNDSGTSTLRFNLNIAGESLKA
jgi:hypothetical protein